jgi:hypothetical protein
MEISILSSRAELASLEKNLVEPTKGTCLADALPRTSAFAMCRRPKSSFDGCSTRPSFDGRPDPVDGPTIHFC